MKKECKSFEEELDAIQRVLTGCAVVSAALTLTALVTFVMWLCTALT